MSGRRKDVGAEIAVSQNVLEGGNDLSADINGTGVDRVAYLSAVVLLTIANGGGSDVVSYQVEESADDSTYTAITGATGDLDESGDAEVEIDLNLTEREQYLRVTFLSGGNTSVATTIDVAATLVLGGAHEMPV